MREELHPGGALSAWLGQVTGCLEHVGRSRDSLRERLGGAAADVGSGSATVAGTVASTTSRSLLGLFFALLTMHVILRAGRAWR